MDVLNEKTLPKYLHDDLTAWKNRHNNPRNIDDCLWCELYGSINSAEHDHLISSEEAWYLREKYLGLERSDLKNVVTLKVGQVIEGVHFVINPF